MKIDEFISETLKGVIKGVKDSQEFAKENGARINPHMNNNPSIGTVYYGSEDGKRAITTIDFDIAVTASNQQESGVNGGIQVYAISLGGKASEKETNQTVSRIKFSINTVLPNVVA